MSDKYRWPKVFTLYKTSCFHPSRSYPGNQTKTGEAGFSLVELMISLGLGMLLMTAVIQTYLSSLEVEKTVLGNSEVQENARFALQFIETNIQQAGFVADPNKTKQAFYAAQDKSVFKDDETLLGFDGKSDSESNKPDSFAETDQLFFRFVSGVKTKGESASWYDCQGGELSDNEDVQMIFFINAETQSLSCSVLSSGKWLSQPLINDVKDFQLLYGIDTSNDGVINQYVDASKITAWNNVRTVQVELVLNSSINSNTDKTFRRIIMLKNADT
ncbi:MAG: PilW family protein [Gammaproteobacteria bacterium]|nr:PilW family protein [Gammaproteobacteria bacterium]